MDLGAVRQALSDQLALHTGMRSYAEARDSASPPCLVVLPAPVALVYGADMSGSVTVSLRVLCLVPSASPIEKAQRSLDALLGVGGGEPMSVAGAVQADPTLGGLVAWAVPVSAEAPHRIEYAGVPMLASHVTVQVGA